MRASSSGGAFTGFLAGALLTLAGCDSDAGGSRATTAASPSSASAPAAAAAPPLMLAAARGEIDTLQALIAAGAQLDERGAAGRTALMAAAQAGQSGAVGILLDAGASADLEDRTGHTALLFAARKGDEPSVQRLLEAGAKPDRASPDGVTPLMEGVRSGNPGVVAHLMAAGADVRARSARGLTVLHFAAASSVDVLRGLLAEGLDLDAVDDRGRTPAMSVARTGRLDLLLLLESAGADLTRVDHAGWSVLDHARRKKHWHVVDHLAARVPGSPSALVADQVR